MVRFLAILAYLCALTPTAWSRISNVRTYSKAELRKLRDEVGEMFGHAYDGYLRYAYPYDELRPLSCDGVDTWGSYSLTLIDALDTLAVVGNHSEFRRVYQLVSKERVNFDSDINVSVFETNIRIVGGLLGAHLMAKRAGAPLEAGWPCNGPLLRLAEDVASRLLPAFDTATGMPYGTVNLRRGVPKGETSVTCVAAVGTYIVEFGALSRLTGNPVYEDTAMRALRSLWKHRSPIGLFGNHIDVQSGKWTATDAGIGAGVDSFYEYLVKGAALLQKPELMQMFKVGRAAVERHLNHDDWYFWAAMRQGSVTMPIFQSLEAFWPGLLSLVGDTEQAMKTILNYHQVWKQYGFLPEFYNVAQGGASAGREGYPLRPELAESAMYLYRATKDPFLLTLGEDMLRSIQHSARTDCGYATVKDSRNHLLEDRMESFFLAETTKYLYLLFDVDSFVHNSGNTATLLKTPHGECVVDAGGYVFNTEAHLIDPAALACCSSHTIDDLERQILDHALDIAGSAGKTSKSQENLMKEFVGDTIPARMRQIEAERAAEAEKRRQEAEEYQVRMEQMRAEQRKHLKAKNAAAAETAKKEKVSSPPPLPAGPEGPESRGVGSSSPGNNVVKVNSTTGLDSDQQPSFSEKLESKQKVVDNTQAPPPSEQLLIQKQTKDETVIKVAAVKETSKQQSQAKPQPAPVGELSEYQEAAAKAAEKEKPGLLEKFSEIIETLLVPDQEFDLQKFKEKLRLDKEKKYFNDSWLTDNSVLSCPAKPFAERFSVQGEVIFS